MRAPLSKQESGASCPDSRRPSANNRPTLSHKASTEGGSRVKNPVFHAPNCDILAHTPGKRSRGSQEGNLEPEDGENPSTSKPGEGGQKLRQKASTSTLASDRGLGAGLGNREPV
ncbi:hypothetical protein WJX82_009427 [Trebouxia sp. C0006]